jgi:hypothetical protein
MKRINIKNIVIQFDGGVVNGTPLEQARSCVEAINEVLATHLQNTCPQLMVTALDHSDVEEEDDGDDGDDGDDVGEDTEDPFDPDDRR